MKRSMACMGFLLAGLVGCQNQASNRSKGASTGNKGSTAHRARQTEPVTAPPSGRATNAASKYDPDKDAANKGGFHFKKADPLDPKAARKKPFSIEALYKIKYVGSPTWSPDGRRILFVVRSFDLAQGKSYSDIYLVDADGKHLKQMTRNEAPDWGPRWSPDGSEFLFLSTRKDDKPQVFVMPADGGEARCVTDLPLGAMQARWGFDGKSVLVSTKVFPNLGTDKDKTTSLLDDIKNSPTKAHVADHLFYRHWTSWRDGKRTHIVRVDMETAKAVDLTPGDFDSPAFVLGNNGAFAVSKDGEIAFESNREPPDARAWTTNKDLFVVAQKGGKQLNLTATNKAYDGHPGYSPDGRWLAFLQQKVPGYEADLFRLAIYDRKKGDIRVFTENFDNWVEEFVWSHDAKKILFQAPVKGRYPLFVLDLATGTIHRVPNVPSVRAFDLSSRNQIAFTFTSVGKPTELFVCNLDGTHVKRLTHFNEAIEREYDIRPVEELWVKGAEGKPVQVFIVKPHGFKKNKRYPLILNVHGGPQGQWSDSLRGDWQVYPGAGYVVAFPNPHGSTGFGQAYTLAISKDWGGKVYRDVMAVADHLAKLPYVDPNRMVAMGWSYGGYMMNWLAGHTKRFKAIATMMGVYDLPVEYGATEELWFPEFDIGGTPWDNPAAYKKWSPSTYAKNFTTPMLIITGERDYRVPYAQSLELFTMLRRRNIPARLIVFPNDGHWPSYVKSMPLYYAAHLDWFHKWVGGDPSPYELRKMVQGRAFKKEKD